MDDIELTVVMPCLNEAETLRTCIDKAQRYFRESGVRGEIVIGDNGSTDGSQAIAAEAGARVINVPVRGYGAALYAAVLAARGRYVIMGDSDDSYDFLNLQPFLDALRAGHDLVMGNRFKGGIKDGAMPWKNRYIGNPILTGIGRLLFRSASGDFHCGLRGFSVDAFRKMDLRTTGMEFASEMVIKATLRGMRVTEVPTTLSKDGRSRPPHLRPWRDGWRHLRFMLLFSPRWLFLFPGALLLLLGLIGGGAIWLAPLSVFRATLDVNTLVFASAAILLGYQVILFALCAHLYAVSQGLLPEEPSMHRVLGVLTLERGLILGAIVLIGGVGFAADAFVNWRATGFGALDPTKSLRIVVPASLAIVLGAQTIFSSFLLSVLRLGIRGK